MSSLSSQLKNRFFQAQQSPKTNLNAPQMANIQRVPSGKISFRENSNQSKSPDDGGQARATQRIPMKNVSFMPAKGFSPPHPQAYSNPVYSLGNCAADQSASNISKVSPTRFQNNKIGQVVIPANQIKLANKQGASPSPESRQTYRLQNLKQYSPPSQQNQNFCKVNFRAKAQKLNENLSDDETNVQSDSEEQTQNFSILKQDPSNNNFNRPKLKDQFSAADQRFPFKSSRGNQQEQRVKIISANKIRHSPSPSHNPIVKGQQSPDIHVVQPAKQQQLASDFIKSMITQSRGNPAASHINSKKATAGAVEGLKYKNSRNQETSPPQHSTILKDIKKNILSKANQSPQTQQSPTDLKDDQAFYSSRLISKLKGQQGRTNSPLDFSNGVPANVQRVQTRDKENQNTAQGQAQANKSPVNEKKESTDKESAKFQFPFQRRARSLSLTKQEEAAAQGESNDHTKSKSPSPGQLIKKVEDGRRNGPIVAKTNFVIAHKALLGKHVQNNDTFERSKEVDEWLMGSGESDATAVSASQRKENSVKKQTELDKPVQPCKGQDLDAHASPRDEDDEDWMFKTFEPVKGKKPQKETRNARINEPHRAQGRSEVFDMESEEPNLGDNPFDMAPEMTKQFSKAANQNTNGFNFEDIANECEDISQYMDQIDSFIQKGFCH